jgi:DNA invertase Pin-like site-specific DNA recombinase
VPLKKQTPKIDRTVALCYIRLSVTKDASDLTSPERQRANIQAACDKYGWTPEWYQDTSGHKSATKEDNRPAWLALKARLTDPDVAALVVNEQSRAMRNTWRAIKLFEELPGFGVVLHLAASDRTLDITSPDGRMSAYFQAFIDDMYAMDAARRARDSVKYRKGRGISIGIPPFGTIRGDDRFLEPSPYGAWLMPDGTYQAGKDSNLPPHAEAVWRGYYECAERILQLYKDNQHGYHHIAETLKQEGWMFRDRQGEPRLINLDDVRRVVSNWREYAGLVDIGRAKERIANEIENPAAVLYDTGQAVFDLELLRAVAQTQEKRSVTRKPTGNSRSAHIFALSHLLYCAHCNVLAIEEDNLKFRTRIIGWKQRDKLRYRHSGKRHCEAKTTTVFASVIEDDFAKLVDLLDVHPEALDLMAQLAVQSEYRQDDMKAEDLEEQKRVNIVKHRRALKNNLTLFQNGDIEADEYYRQKDHHDRQIALWEARTTDKQKVLLELATCMQMVKRIKEFWNITQGEDRKMLAHSLFDEIVYDLDRRRIVDFKLASWAEPFLILRAALYEDEMGEEMKNRFNSGISSDVSYVDPNETRTRVFTLKG